MLNAKINMESTTVSQPHTPPRNTHNKGVCPSAPRANRKSFRRVPINNRANRNLIYDFEMASTQQTDTVYNQTTALQLLRML